MSNPIKDGPGGRAIDPDAHHKIGEALLEIDRLLDRIERSTTHYQILGIERSSDRAQITAAYRGTVTVLGRASNELTGMIPLDQLARIKAAVGRAGEAFTVLNSIVKRADYDNWLRKRTGRPTDMALGSDAVPVETEPDEQHPSQPVSASEQYASGSGSASRTIQHTESIYQGRVYSNLPGGNKGSDRRRCSRLSMNIPGRITGFTKTGEKWNEIVRTVDVSRMGASLAMKEHPKVGNVLHLMLPLPTKLRSHGYTEPSYTTYVLVHRVEPTTSDSRVVGVEFLGVRPPSEYFDSPWSVFRPAEWRGPDRRRVLRIERTEAVALQFLDQSFEMVGRGSAKTENISTFGARICVTEQAPDFEFLRVNSTATGFESLAAVCNRYRGTDGRLRLCIRFLDQQWPGLPS
jgi:hypothetical protein